MPTALGTYAECTVGVDRARFVAAKVPGARPLLRGVLPGFQVVAPFEVLAAVRCGLVVVEALGRPGIIFSGVSRDTVDGGTYLLEPETFVGGVLPAFAHHRRSDVVITLGASGEVRQQLGRRRGAGHCEREVEREDSRGEVRPVKDVT